MQSLVRACIVNRLRQIIILPLDCISFFFKKIYVSECVLCLGGNPWGSEEGIGSPGAEVTGSCELSEVGSGNRTLVLWGSRTSSHRAQIFLYNCLSG